MKIQIAHLYPENLNLYGDKGNIASLVYRLGKRNIDCDVIKYALNDEIDFENTDIMFIGGGTDKDREPVLNALMKNKEKIKAYASDGGVILACCTGFELLGNHIEADNKRYEALGILDMHTLYKDKRQIGNIVIKSDITGGLIAGFENHSAQVQLGDVRPFGRVVSGYGNDGKSGFEGAVYKNVLATFLHGPLLPKNPQLADYIIKKALEKKYGEINLEELDDTIENAAHDYAVKRFS